MRSQARLLIGVIVAVAAFSVSTNARAFGRQKPKPDPVPSASPTPQPSPAPSPEPLPIQLGQIAVAGTGCPIATTEVVPSDDLRTYTVATPALATVLQQGATLARAACTIAIPIGAVPAGMRLVITEASATGGYSLAAAASGKATLEAFFAGQMSDPAELPVGSADAATQGGLDLIKENAALGECGKDEIVRLNTSLTLTQPAMNASSSMSFSRLQLKIELLPCDDQL